MSTPIFYRRLTEWPDAHKKAQWLKSPYTAGDDTIKEQIKRELRLRNARSTALEMFLPERFMGADGLPLAKAPDLPRNAIGFQPGVILTVVLSGKPARSLVFPCATYSTWRGNLRAIGEVLEKLRLIERDGVGTGQEQYQGYETGLVRTGTAATSTPPPRIFTVQEEAAARTLLTEASRFDRNAYSIVGTMVADIITNPDYRSIVYRSAVQAAHPDKGGNSARFRAVTDARDFLDKGTEAR